MINFLIFALSIYSVTCEHTLQQMLRKIKLYSISISQYCYYRWLSYPKRATDKIIFIEVKKNYFKRYFYGFIKFLHMSGYTIYIDPSLKLFYEIRNEKWESFIFSEKLVILGKPSPNNKPINITESQLSPDYFSKSYNKSNTSYHVPMMQHPLMYNRGWWNEAIENSNRKASLFMAGNFDAKIYTSFKKHGIFKMISRLEIYTFLKSKLLLYNINSTPELKMFLDSKADNKIILIDRLQLDVLMYELRNVLSRFTFFFALPGIEIPYSHNLIEAMSCGCIPFIQKEYADIIIPKLQNGINAITFTNIDDLENRIAFLFSLHEDEIEKMRGEVFDYYNRYLIPEKIVAALEEINFEKIYLQAEHHSVELLKINHLNKNFIN